MISTRFHHGQGLGNQLWSYVFLRTLAEDLNLNFGIINPGNFKGKDFMRLDFGKEPAAGARRVYVEKATTHPLNGADIRVHDDGFKLIGDDTEIEGLFQDELYIAHRKAEIKKWLRTGQGSECTDLCGDDICVMNFRGSGYVYDKNVFLPRKYWTNAMDNMRAVNPSMRFVVITEDVKSARIYFPELEIRHMTIGRDYSAIKNARYLILSNSSFAWFPAWLSDNLCFCIAPKYWGRHNVSDGFWSLGYNITKGWMYQDRMGKLYDYDSCISELNKYVRSRPYLYGGTGACELSFGAWFRERARIAATLSRESPLPAVIMRIIGIEVLKLSRLARGWGVPAKPLTVEDGTGMAGSENTATSSLSGRAPGIKRLFRGVAVKMGYY